MTEGQQLAIEQLRAVQERALGAFEVVQIAEQLNAAGWLAAYRHQLGLLGKGIFPGRCPAEAAGVVYDWRAGGFPLSVAGNLDAARSLRGLAARSMEAPSLPLSGSRDRVERQ